MKGEYIMNNEQDYTITNSEEYKEYISALCRCSSQWVASIQIQYARKAYQMYQNETVRKLVLEYGRQIEKLDKTLLDQFRWACRDGDEARETSLYGDCLNLSGSLAKTIHYLFDIDMMPEHR